MSRGLIAISCWGDRSKSGPSKSGQSKSGQSVSGSSLADDKGAIAPTQESFKKFHKQLAESVSRCMAGAIIETDREGLLDKKWGSNKKKLGFINIKQCSPPLLIALCLSFLFICPVGLTSRLSAGSVVRGFNCPQVHLSAVSLIKMLH